MPKKKIRKCRFCGCTDKKACPGGCWWIAKDVCSACEGRLLVELWNKFQNENPKCFETPAAGQYLKNRIELAFKAGWDAAKKYMQGCADGNRQG
jgi:hypothetical protein